MFPLSRRGGFTAMEVVLSLVFLGMAAAIVGELAVFALNERLHNETRLAVIEWATNVLEDARARPWAEVTPEWAGNTQLPDDLSIRLSEPKVSVKVEPELDYPAAKRVTVSVQWTQSDGVSVRPVTLATVISDRKKRESP